MGEVLDVALNGVGLVDGLVVPDPKVLDPSVEGQRIRDLIVLRDHVPDALMIVRVGSDVLHQGGIEHGHFQPPLLPSLGYPAHRFLLPEWFGLAPGVPDRGGQQLMDFPVPGIVDLGIVEE